MNVSIPSVMKQRIGLDSTLLREQLDEVLAVIEALPPSQRVDIEDELEERLHRLCTTVALGDPLTIRNSDGTVDVRYLIRFGPQFHTFLSALRKGAFDD